MSQHFTSIKSLLTRCVVCEHGVECQKCCWEWNGAVDAEGRAVCSYYNRSTTVANVMMHELHGLGPREKIKTGKQCRNKECCNYNHMYIKQTAERGQAVTV